MDVHEADANARKFSTTRQRMLAGQWFHSPSLELTRLHCHAQTLLQRFNQLSPLQFEARQELLSKLFGAIGQRSWIETGLQCAYGEHIEIGDDVYINVNCTLLDGNRIEIGHRVYVSPNVQMITTTHPVHPAHRTVEVEGRRKCVLRAEPIKVGTCRSKCVEAPSWSPKPKDRRRLSELVQLWYELHGVSLTDGLRRFAILKAAAQSMGDPVARSVEGAHVASIRAKWMAKGVTGKTVNNRLGYLKAVYNELHKLDVIDYPCPFSRIQPVRLQERPLAYLTKPQIAELLEALCNRSTAPHTAMVAHICLATGARWGEAQALRPEAIKGNVLVFSNTKSKRVRHVPVSPVLVDAIRKHWNQHGPFSNCIGVFRKVLLSTSINPPRGQASHILRHTFAAHFIMGGGHIVTLKEILGHASLSMTMRYAHLAPEHLHDAIRLGPLADFNLPAFSSERIDGGAPLA